MSAEANPVNIQTATTFQDFYPLYLNEHRDINCRRTHFIGTSLVILFSIAAFFTGEWLFLLCATFCGYGGAWLGHFAFEKNKPASFKRPLYSFLGDWVMYKDIIIGRVRIL